jgi:hypothetical protein
MVNAVDVIQPLLGEDIARRLEAALTVEEDVPLVRVAQAHQVRRQECRRGHLADPVDGERVHCLEHAVAYAVDQLEVTDDFLGRERLDLELASRLLLDRSGPGLERLQADARRPRGLHFPRHRFCGRCIPYERGAHDCGRAGGSADGLQQPSPCRLLDRLGS